jgi:hypothetical protein
MHPMTSGTDPSVTLVLGDPVSPEDIRAMRHLKNFSLHCQGEMSLMNHAPGKG